MSESAQPKFACPSCGRQFGWKPELAGRSAKCKCGNTIKVPAQPPAAAAPAAVAAESNPLDGYDFHEAAAAAPPKRAAAAPAADAGLRCPSCQNPLQPGAVICVHCGFNLKTGKRMSTVMGGEDAPAPAAKAVPGPGVAGAFGAPPGIRPPRQQETNTASGAMKLIAIPIVLVAVVGGAVFGFKKLSGPKDTTPKLGMDGEVLAMIEDDGATELKQWLKEGSTRLVNGVTREQADGMADKLYEMGAIKVLAFGGVMTMSIAVELPDNKTPEDQEKRKAIFAWYKRRYESELSSAVRQRDVGQRYLLVRP